MNKHVVILKNYGKRKGKKRERSFPHLKVGFPRQLRDRHLHIPLVMILPGALSAVD